MGHVDGDDGPYALRRPILEEPKHIAAQTRLGGEDIKSVDYKEQVRLRRTTGLTELDEGGYVVESEGMMEG